METRISIGIIILLTLLLGWIYFQQYKYDVNLYRGKISFNNPVYDLNQVPSNNMVGGTPSFLLRCLPMTQPRFNP